MRAHSLDLTRDGMIAALTGAAPEPVAEPTVGEFIAWVRAHPSNPYSNIGCFFIGRNVRSADPLPAIYNRLTIRLARERRKVEVKHWSADPFYAADIKAVLNLIDEFSAVNYGEAA